MMSDILFVDPHDPQGWQFVIVLGGTDVAIEVRRHGGHEPTEIALDVVSANVIGNALRAAARQVLGE